MDLETLKTKLFDASTCGSQEHCEQYFVPSSRDIGYSILRTLETVKDPKVVHEALEFLITKKTGYMRVDNTTWGFLDWKEILEMSCLKGGTVKLFTKMMECDMDYVMKNFEDLFLRVNFFDDVEFGRVWTEDCMNMLLSSPLTTKAVYNLKNEETEKGKVRNSMQCALMILRQTGRLDFMQRYIESVEGGFSRYLLRVAEITRQFLAKKHLSHAGVPPDEQFYNFLKSYLSVEIGQGTRKLEYLWEALQFVNDIPSSNLLQYHHLISWICTALQNVIDGYTDKKIAMFATSDKKRISDILTMIEYQHDHEINPKSWETFMPLRQKIANLKIKICSDVVQKATSYQIQENIKASSSSSSSSIIYIWNRPVPSTTIPSKASTDVLRLANAQIFRCPVANLSEIPYYDQFMKMAEFPQDSEAIVGCIEVEVEDDNKKDMKQFAVFQNECLIEIGKFAKMIISTNTTFITTSIVPSSTDLK